MWDFRNISITYIIPIRSCTLTLHAVCKCYFTTLWQNQGSTALVKEQSILQPYCSLQLKLDSLATLRKSQWNTGVIQNCYNGRIYSKNQPGNIFQTWYQIEVCSAVNVLDIRFVSILLQLTERNKLYSIKDSSFQLLKFILGQKNLI